MLAFYVYLASIVEQVVEVINFILVALVLVYAVIMFMIFNISDSYTTINRFKKFSIIFAAILIFIKLLISFIPNKQDMYIIGSVYFGEKIVSDIYQTAEWEKARKVINNKLDDMLKEEASSEPKQ